MLTAIDLATRKTLWRRPLGTGRDSGPLGYPSLLPLEIGTPNIGGTLVTGSGLIFFGGTLDRYLRAFDIHTGEELWKARLPAGGQATPMTYVSAESGRQFIVISAGGHVGLDTRLGDWIVAYALPETDRE
jgi:quinoprotein glucose dehydrogenase